MRVRPVPAPVVLLAELWRLMSACVPSIYFKGASACVRPPAPIHPSVHPSIHPSSRVRAPREMSALHCALWVLLRENQQDARTRMYNIIQIDLKRK